MGARQPERERPVLRERAIGFNEWAGRQIRTTYPALGVVAIGLAFLLALLNLMQALGNRYGALAEVGRHVAVATWRGPAALSALLAVFMLVLTYELWLGKRAALYALSGFIVVQAVADVLKGMSHVEGAFFILAAMVLLLPAGRFPARPDPASYRRFKAALPVSLALFFTVGIGGLYLMRGPLGLQGQGAYSLAFKSLQVAAGQGRLAFHGWAVLYRDLLTITALSCAAYLVVLLFRPCRAQPPDPAERERARGLVEEHGRDSLAYFNLRDDKSLFFQSDEIFIAYRLVGDVAVMSGDPVGPPELVPRALESFKRYCSERGWRAGAVGASGELRPVYKEAGFEAFGLGEEAIIDLDRFTLEGRAMRKLRQSVSRIERMGITCETLFNSSIPSHVRHDLAAISADWRSGRGETGFSMGLGRLLSPEDPDCLLSIAYDVGMRPLGFVYWVPMYPGLGYSLDIHRTRLDAPGALSEYLIAKTALFLKANGYRELALHFLALSEHYREDRQREGSPAWRAVARVADHIFPVVSVYRFDKKFLPAWKPRLLLYGSAADFLLVALAVVSAESALKVTRPRHRKKRS